MVGLVIDTPVPPASPAVRLSVSERVREGPAPQLVIQLCIQLCPQPFQIPARTWRKPVRNHLKEIPGHSPSPYGRRHSSRRIAETNRGEGRQRLGNRSPQELVPAYSCRGTTRCARSALGRLRGIGLSEHSHDADHDSSTRRRPASPRQPHQLTAPTLLQNCLQISTAIDGMLYRPDDRPHTADQPHLPVRPFSISAVGPQDRGRHPGCCWSYPPRLS